MFITFMQPTSSNPSELATISFIDAYLGDDSDDDGDDVDYNVSCSDTESKSDSEFWSGSDISDAEQSEISDITFEVDSDSEDSDDESDDLQIDYLCIANPPCRIAVENPVTIGKVMMHGTGYTLCGDNIDKNVRRRYQRSDKSTISLHYFHMYGVKNRVDVSHLSDVSPSCTLDKKAKAMLVMPSPNDDLQLKKNIAILVSRVLVNHMEFFKFCFSDVTCWHIKHQHYEEMSTKSVVVSTAVCVRESKKKEKEIITSGNNVWLCMDPFSACSVCVCRARCILMCYP